MSKNKSKTKSVSKKAVSNSQGKTFWQKYKKIIVIGVVVLASPFLLWKGFWTSVRVCMFFEDKRLAEDALELLEHPIASGEIPGVARKNLTVYKGGDRCYNLVGFSVDPLPTIRFDIVSDSGKSLSEARAALIEYAQQQGFAKKGDDDHFGVVLTSQQAHTGRHYEVFVNSIDRSRELVHITLEEVQH